MTADWRVVLGVFDRAIGPAKRMPLLKREATWTLRVVLPMNVRQPLTGMADHRDAMAEGGP